jgi:hypothetical protein
MFEKKTKAVAEETQTRYIKTGETVQLRDVVAEVSLANGVNTIVKFSEKIKPIFNDQYEISNVDFFWEKPLEGFTSWCEARTNGDQPIKINPDHVSSIRIISSATRNVTLGA